MSPTSPSSRYWEATYEPGRQRPTEVFTLAELKDVVGPESRIVRANGVKRATFREKVIRTCYIEGVFSELTFAGCIFENCNFEHCEWHAVKFTDCTFRKCHFSYVRFIDCLFLNATFDKITASAEHVAFTSTSIQARHFLRALFAPIEHLPVGKSAREQQLRLTITAAKLAHTLLASTRDEPDLDLFFDAQREFETRRLLAKKAELTLALEARSITRLSAAIAQLVNGIESGLVYSAGFITSWGQSISFPVLLLMIVTVVFGGAYHATGIAPSIALARAIDTSLVAGYTRYPFTDDLTGWLSTLHAAIGVYWYAMVIPVIVRRTLR